jgi:hypothetical protein
LDNPKYIRSQDFIFRKIVDETILVPIRQNVAELNCIYSLNEIGTMLWQLLREPQTPADLQAFILREFEIPADQAYKDVQAFLDQLLSYGALQEA